MSGAARILLADIGGTNARFALADPALASPLILDSMQRYPVVDFPSLADAARHYLRETGQEESGIREGIFAVAGHVDGVVERAIAGAATPQGGPAHDCAHEAGQYST